MDDDGLEIGEGVNIDSIKQRPKITRAIIEEIKSLQTRDLFEDIMEVKGETKLSNLQGNRQNLIELKDYLRDMYKKSFANKHKQTKSTTRKNKSEGASAAGEDDQHQSSFDGRSSQMKDDGLMFGAISYMGQAEQQLQGQNLIEAVDRMFEGNSSMQVSR